MTQQHDPRTTWPRKIRPLSGQTTQHTTYHCGGLIESHTLHQYHSCPTSTDASTTPPEGWTRHPQHGWLCPDCTTNNGEPRTPMGKYQGNPTPLHRHDLT